MVPPLESMPLGPPLALNLRERLVALTMVALNVMVLSQHADSGDGPASGSFDLLLFFDWRKALPAIFGGQTKSKILALISSCIYLSLSLSR